MTIGRLMNLCQLYAYSLYVVSNLTTLIEHSVMVYRDKYWVKVCRASLLSMIHQ